MAWEKRGHYSEFFFCFLDSRRALLDAWNSAIFSSTVCLGVPNTFFTASSNSDNGASGSYPSGFFLRGTTPSHEDGRPPVVPLSGTALDTL